ncbi:MAG: hypothetical protein M0Q88_00665 [Bacilli bacterium]|nr:hypothetical protein [Bacilli bacterium]
MDNLCTKCDYKHLCKFKEDFIKIESKIDFHLKDLIEANKQIFFNIKLECQFFKEEFPTLATNKRPLDYSTTDRSYDPCRDCLNKPDLTKGLTVGDRVCDWCQHNPYKLTCLTAK